MEIEIRGDRIGTYSDARLNGTQPPRAILTLRGVKPLGARTQTFRLDPADSAAGHPLYRLRATNGAMLARDLAPRTDLPEGLGVGTTHVLLENGEGTRIVVELDGLAEGESRRVYAQEPDRRERRRDLDEAEPPGGAACFAAGTRVTGRLGRQRIEDLRPGDPVWTLDRGLQPVRWIGRQTVAFGPETEYLRPVRIAPGALGAGAPAREVVLAPHHRVLVTGWRAELFFGMEEILVPARALTGAEGVTRDTAAPHVSYVGLVFEQHEILEVGGLLCESLHLDSLRVEALTDAERSDLFTVFPQLRLFRSAVTCGPVRPTAALGEGQIGFG